MNKQPRQRSTGVAASVPNRFFLSVYYVKAQDVGRNRPFETAIHKIRDGLAIAELVPALILEKYHYGGAVLNVPMAVQPALCKRGKFRATTLTPPWCASDIVLLLTRPALDDPSVPMPGGRGPRRIDTSGSELELITYNALRRFFGTCTRSRVTLTSEVQFASRDARFRDIRFRVQASKHVRAAGAVDWFLPKGAKPQRPDFANLTVGYLAAIPSACTSSPRVLAVFGMGGTETLWLTRLLTTTLRAELQAAIRTPAPRLRLISFRVPSYAPFPWLHAEPDELAPKVIATTVSV